MKGFAKNSSVVADKDSNRYVNGETDKLSHTVTDKLMGFADKSSVAATDNLSVTNFPKKTASTRSIRCMNTDKTRFIYWFLTDLWQRSND